MVALNVAPPPQKRERKIAKQVTYRLEQEGHWEWQRATFYTFTFTQFIPFVQDLGIGLSGSM